MWGAICQLGGYGALGNVGKLFRWQANFREKGKVNKKVWYGLLGVVIAFRRLC